MSLSLQEQYLSAFFSKERRKRIYLESNGLPYKINWDFRQSAYYFNFQIDYLHQEMLSLDYTPVFITLTLPSEYHLKGKKKNVKYSKYSINQGYKKLQYMFRYLYKNFQESKKHIKTRFVRVIEPHKSFIPHLHAIIYVPSDKVFLFRKHFDNLVKKEKLEQFDYKVLDKTKYSVVYLLKYVNKSFNPDMDSFYYIRGWALENKIRQFTISNISNLTFYDFKILNKYIKYDDSSKDCYIKQIENKTFIQIDYFDSKGKFLKRVCKGDFKSPFKFYKEVLVFDKPFESSSLSLLQSYSILGKDINFLKFVDVIDYYKVYKIKSFKLFYYDELIELDRDSIYSNFKASLPYDVWIEKDNLLEQIYYTL